MLEGKFRAREIDFERAAPSDDVSATGDKGAGGDAGATGTRLVLNTALVGADEEGSIGMKFNKIDIGTVREKVGTVANTTSFAHNVVVFQVEDLLHEMRGTGVEEDALATIVITEGAQRVEADAAHGESHQTTSRFGVPVKNGGIMRAVWGEEMKRVFGETGGNTQNVGEKGDTAATVATHRSGAAVAVEETHLKIKCIAPHLQKDESVGTDTGTTVAEGGYFFGGEVDVAFPVVEDYKIVRCTIKFIEMHL